MQHGKLTLTQGAKKNLAAYMTPAASGNVLELCGKGAYSSK